MSGNQTANLIYMLILLFFIGGSLFYGRKVNWNKTAQQAGIWLLLFLGLIIAYGFKDTLREQLAPFYYPKIALDENGQSVTFQKARDGHFHARVIINGEAVHFLIDTGATALVLNKAAARAVGIDMDSLVFNGRSYTANGVVRSARVVLQTVELGGIKDTEVRASVNEGDLGVSLLGMDYLARFGEINIKGDLLTLVR